MTHPEWLERIRNEIAATRRTPGVLSYDSASKLLAYVDSLEKKLGIAEEALEDMQNTDRYPKDYYAKGEALQALAHIALIKIRGKE